MTKRLTVTVSDNVSAWQVLSIALGKMVRHDLGNVVLRVVPTKVTSGVIIDVLDDIVTEARKNAPRFLIRPLLGNALAQVVLVEIEMAVQLSKDISDLTVVTVFPDARVQEGLQVFVVVERNVDTFHKGAVIVGLHVLVDMEIVDSRPPEGHSQVEILKQSMATSVGSILEQVSRQEDNHRIEVVGPGTPEHPATLILLHDGSNVVVGSHFGTLFVNFEHWKIRFRKMASFFSFLFVPK